MLGRPHVRARLEALIDEYVSRFEVDPDALEASFGDIDPTDPSSFAKASWATPRRCSASCRRPAQREVLSRIETLLAVIAGYVDHVLDTVGHGLIGSYGRIAEALRRRRVESSDGDRFAARLLGLQLGAAQYEKGARLRRGASSSGPARRACPASGSPSGSCPPRPSSTPPGSGWPASTCPD